MNTKHNQNATDRTLAERVILVCLCLLMLMPPGSLTPILRAQEPQTPSQTSPQSQDIQAPPLPADSTVFVDEKVLLEVDSIPPTEVRADDYAYDESGRKVFNPSPTKAVWISVLCPGLGQIYNRRYWKLPIVIGGFMGLAYATNWNNNQYQDYLQGYRDLLDNDPQSNSYMDFFPPTVSESDLDRKWLEQVFKSRKDYARRNRDLCIIGLVALYALCILDAYVDASLTHFDVSSDLAVDWAPTLMPPAGGGNKPALGLNWAFTF